MALSHHAKVQVCPAVCGSYPEEVPDDLDLEAECGGSGLVVESDDHPYEVHCDPSLEVRCGYLFEVHYDLSQAELADAEVAVVQMRR